MAGPIREPASPLLVLLFDCRQRPAMGVAAIARADAYVYAGFRTTEIVRVIPTGGPPELLAHDPTPNASLEHLVVTTSGIFYTVVTGGTPNPISEIRVLHLGSTPMVAKRFDSTMMPMAIAEDGSEIYVSVRVNTTSHQGKLIAVNKTSFAEREVASGIVYPGDLAVDATHVYVASAQVGLVRAPKLGGAPEIVIDAPMANFHGVALSASYGTVLDRGTPPEMNDARILKWPKAPAAVPTTIAQMLRPRSGLLLDGDDVLVWAGVPPKAGDPGIDPRPLRVAPNGTKTELGPMTLAGVGYLTLAADDDAFYFGGTTTIARRQR